MVGGAGGGKTNGMYCWAKFTEEPDLPVGFTSLEYLDLTGANYFITDYTITSTNYSTTKVVADIAITGTSSNNYRIDGTAANSVHFYFGIASNSCWGYSCSSDSTTSVTADTSRHIHTFDVLNKKYTVDSLVNVTLSPSNSKTISNPFCIGGYFDQGYNNDYIMHGKRIWSYEIYDNGVLVRKYLPCKDASGVICLYDTVQKKCLYTSGSGACSSDVEGGVITPDGYILSDNLNAYPQDGYHTDGYYYRLLDNDIAWDERGRYAWSKAAGPADVFYEFATKKNMTVSGNALTSGSSASGWDSAYVVTAGIDVSDPELEVRIEHTIPATGRSYFIAVSDTNATASSQFDHTLFVNGTSLLQGTSGSGSIGTCAVGDVVGLSIKNGTVSYLKNGSALTTGTLSASTVYFTVMVNGAGINWGNFIVSTPGVEPFGYVIGNEEDAYPNDGFADDGYYYVKVGATKVTPKYASGSVNAVAAKVTVNGLGFKPYAVMLQYSTAAIGYGVLDGASGTITAYSKISSNNNATATFVSKDDGFEFTGANWSTYPFDWYAIGY